jgi:hypothetical protein
MRRREFIAGLGSAAAWPVVAQAQDKPLPVIGYLGSQSANDDYKNFTVPFLRGLKETGYVEGQNVAVEYRYAENQMDRLPSLAADLVRRRDPRASARTKYTSRHALQPPDPATSPGPSRHSATPERPPDDDHAFWSPDFVGPVRRNEEMYCGPVFTPD